MKEYKGTHTEHGFAVTVEDDGDSRGLDPRLDLRNHSPAGFGWGFGGSERAQLALAVCADALRDDDRAQDVYQAFKFRVVAGLPAAGWTLSEREVLEHVHAIERQREAGRADLETTTVPAEGTSTPLTRRLDAHLADLAAEFPTAATDRLSGMRVRGLMEAVRQLAAHGGLTHAGQVEAEQMLTASRDWLRDKRDEQAEGRAGGRGG